MKRGMFVGSVLLLGGLVLSGCSSEPVSFLDGVDEVTPSAFSTDDQKQLSVARTVCITALDDGFTVDDQVESLTSQSQVGEDEAREYVTYTRGWCEQVFELTGGVVR